MLGAIAGDIIGSAYEGRVIKSTIFELFSRSCMFTDDTVLTVATAQAILEHRDYADAYRTLGRQYPDAGYGGHFIRWLFVSEPEPYGSWGNGSAMRVSPVGFAFEDLDTVLQEAGRSAAVTHNHPEGIKGAQAVAAAVFLARHGNSKADIKNYLEKTFSYDLSTPLAVIRPRYHFDVSCQGSVPQALTAFLESEDVEDAIRKAVSLGGDTDTQACMAGAVAHAFYGEIPLAILKEILARLPAQLLEICARFMETYRVPGYTVGLPTAS